MKKKIRQRIAAWILLCCMSLSFPSVFAETAGERSTEAATAEDIQMDSGASEQEWEENSNGEASAIPQEESERSPMDTTPDDVGSQTQTEEPDAVSAPEPTETPSPSPETPEPTPNKDAQPANEDVFTYPSPGLGPVADVPQETSGETDAQIQDPDQAQTLGAAKYLLISGHDKYMSGYTDGTFRPENHLTRAEFAMIIYNSMENPPAVVGGQFNDVDNSIWYGDAVNSLGVAGIFKGDGNKKFRPNDKINRAEVTAVLCTLTQESANGKLTFSDVEEDFWGYKHILTAFTRGWVSGYGDNTFRPLRNTSRAEVTIMVNKVLKRRDDADFAKDRNNPAKHFKDVPTSYWAFLDVIEAGEPVDNPTPAPNPDPTPNPVAKTVFTTAAVNFRTAPVIDSANIITTLPVGTSLTVLDDTSHGEWIKAKHASYGDGFVHGEYVSSNAPNPGPGPNPDPAPNPGPNPNVISHTSATIAQYKTFYIKGSHSNWSSDNPDIASVFTKSGDATKAFIYGKAPGSTTIRMRDSSGNEIASCKVTVTGSEAVRFAYASPNTPYAGKTTKLYAVTDAGKTAVKFVVTGAATGSYESTSYTTETKDASKTSPVPANTVRVFEAQAVFNTPGSYQVQVYSKSGSGDWSTGYQSFNMIVSSDQDAFATSMNKRSASNEIISVIANLEGKGKEPGEIYIDELATGKVPTVGYGFVVYPGNYFYNNCTETEMRAMLADTINNGSYVQDLQKFQSNYNFKMNQVQFDALVSFGYNLGTGYFKDGTTNTFNILLNAMTTPSLPAGGTLNAGSATIYGEPGGGNAVGSAPSGSSLTVTEVRRIDGNVDSLWYRVSYNGASGWIKGGLLRFSNITTRDLAHIDEQLFGSNLMEWNSAGGTRLAGLVYRRLAEAKIFCYGNYTDAYHSSPNYRKNVGFDVPQGVSDLNLQ